MASSRCGEPEYRDIARLQLHARSHPALGQQTVSVWKDSRALGQKAAVRAPIALPRRLRREFLTRLEFERALGARLDESSPLDLPLLSTLLTTGS